ncbi:MAG: hypothetical protein LKJ77_08110 [Sphingobium sp.]|nr:hypothetical protein [Sphingobium sp.]
MTHIPPYLQKYIKRSPVPLPPAANDNIALRKALNAALNGEPANDSGPIHLPPKEAYRDPFVMQGLSIAVGTLVDTSRRDAVEWLCAALWDYHGSAFAADGSTYYLCCVDPDAILRSEEDPSFRWVSRFLSWQHKTPKQKPHNDVLPRLELMYLGLACTHLDVAHAIIP